MLSSVVYTSSASDRASQRLPSSPPNAMPFDVSISAMKANPFNVPRSASCEKTSYTASAETLVSKRTSAARCQYHGVCSSLCLAADATKKNPSAAQVNPNKINMIMRTCRMFFCHKNRKRHIVLISSHTFLLPYICR